MACFIVPATEAVVTTIIEKKCKKEESKRDETKHLNIYGMEKSHHGFHFLLPCKITKI